MHVSCCIRVADFASEANTGLGRGYAFNPGASASAGAVDITYSTSSPSYLSDFQLLVFEILRPCVLPKLCLRGCVQFHRFDFLFNELEFGQTLSL